MEVIILLLLIAFLILYSNANSSHKTSLTQLQRKVDVLIEQTSQLKNELKKFSGESTASPAETSKKETVQPEQRQVWQPQKPVSTEPATPKPFGPKINTELKEVVQPKYEPMYEVKESWMQKWVHNNPDLEKFIGENLINKIGIAILVLGISFFVKYAIDQNWINELGRVCIGLFCGALLTGVAHYLRNSYRSFSSVLAGGGIAVFYFTIAFAFHQYHLLSQTAAFLVMVIITGFAIALSLLYDKIELAVIALVGGFITPFLVSTGEGNYVVLFTYLVILNVGLLALSFFKRWFLINVLAFFFTELIFGGWLVKIWWQENPHVSYALVLLFATILYLLFVAINTVYQLKYKQSFNAFDFSLLLLLNGSYFAAGLLVLERINGGQFQGLFTLGIGCINLLLAWYFFKRQQSQKQLLYLLIGLTLSFLSLTVPIQLKGHAITLFWSVEFVLLLWLYQRSQIRLFYFSSLFVVALSIISLLMDWANAASNESTNLVLIFSNTQGLVTNIVAAGCFASYALLLKKATVELPKFIPEKTLRQSAWLVAIIIAYLTAVYEINLIFRQLPNYDIPNIYHRLITQLAIAIILYVLYRKKLFGYSWPIAGAVCIYLVYHLFSSPFITGLRNGALKGDYSFIHLVIHWVSTLSILYLVYQCILVVRKTPVPYISISRFSWVLSIILLIFFSNEAEHLFVVLGYNRNSLDYLEDQYIKAVLTIVWALCSFGLMWLGMRYKNKTLRIISLSIFCLALLKLFFFDLVDISAGGKIAAFILLGVLLLTISFMYQKLKKIIIDDGKP